MSSYDWTWLECPNRWECCSAKQTALRAGSSDKRQADQRQHSSPCPGSPMAVLHASSIALQHNDPCIPVVPQGGTPVRRMGAPF